MSLWATKELCSTLNNEFFTDQPFYPINILPSASLSEHNTMWSCDCIIWNDFLKTMAGIAQNNVKVTKQFSSSGQKNGQIARDNEMPATYKLQFVLIVDCPRLIKCQMTCDRFSAELFILILAHGLQGDEWTCYTLGCSSNLDADCCGCSLLRCKYCFIADGEIKIQNR